MIKLLLETLTSDILEELMYAFNEEKQYFYILPTGEFLAVHVANPDDYEIIEIAGCWYYGKYKEQTNA